jgi:hypothetical protein
MLNVTSIKKSRNTTKIIGTMNVSTLGLTSSPLRVQSQIQYSPVYGISNNVIANHPVLQNSASAYSSNYSDILHVNSNVPNVSFGFRSGHGKLYTYCLLIDNFDKWLFILTSSKYYIEGETIGIVLPNLPTSNEEGNTGTNIPNLPTSNSQKDSVIKSKEDFEDEPSSDATEALINKGMFISFRCLFNYIIFFALSLIIFILF